MMGRQQGELSHRRPRAAKRTNKNLSLSLSHARRARTLLLNYIICVFSLALWAEVCCGAREEFPLRETNARLFFISGVVSGSSWRGSPACLPACVYNAMPLLDFIFSRILSHSPECCCWPATSSIMYNNSKT